MGKPAATRPSEECAACAHFLPRKVPTGESIGACRRFPEPITKNGSDYCFEFRRKPT